ncbi:MAG TPA: hypothetical protein VFC57_09885 [Aeromicrobium sp.]|nr:hypothetical protein [Aeromicrobium sp.]
MNFRTLKRAAALAAAGALCAITLSPVTAEATVSPSATDAGKWLAGELEDGLITTNYEYEGEPGEFVDYGLSIDVLFALQEADTQGTAQGAIISALSDKVLNYISDPWSPDTRYAGQSAKLLVAAQESGKNPESFDGQNLVKTVEDSVTDSGRVADRNNAYGDNANMLGQAFALEGLAGAESSKLGAVRKFVWGQQCKDGSFSVKFNDCENASVDATAAVVDALTAAKADGVGELDPAIDKASAWLGKQQKSDGSFGGDAITADSNTNSTGLAAHALAAVGNEKAARKAAAWMFSLQVTSANTGDKLEGDQGAVALSKEQFEAGQQDGITKLARDQWRRATSQAIYGLIHLDPGTIQKVIVDKRVEVPGPVVRTKTITGGNAANVVVTEGEKIADEAETPQGKLGQFLASKLSNGDHVEVKDGDDTFVDYDLTADTALALRLLGEQSKFADRITKFLLDKDSIDAFAYGAPYEKKAVYVEPVAKLIIAASLVSKPDSAKIDALAGDLGVLQNEDGAFVDDGKYADKSDGMERHVLAVLAALIAGEDDAADKGIAYLESVQCDDGGFPAILAMGCKVGDPAATGWALQALNAMSDDARADDERLAAVPTDWDHDRASHIASAIKSLHQQVRVDGAVVDGKGATNLEATAAVAAGRQAVGLDTRAAAQVLAGAQVKDGGLPKSANDRQGNLAVTAASAPGVAGSSWLSTSLSGLTNAIALPLIGVGAVIPAARQTVDAGEISIPRWAAYGGAALLAALLLGALVLAIVQGIGRSKGVHA